MEGTAKAEKSRRRFRLKEIIKSNPFITDDELARVSGVSRQTIRLDRMALGIPEVRERTRNLAIEAHQTVKSLVSGELTGELLDLELGERAISLLETDASQTFKRSRVVRGEYLFAQADSLALALVDAEVAQVIFANVKFRRSILAGERLLAKGEVLRRKQAEHVILVTIRSGAEEVFRGKFVVTGKAMLEAAPKSAPKQTAPKTALELE